MRENRTYGLKGGWGNGPLAAPRPSFFGNAFTASLVRAGSVYTGTAPLDDYNWCVHPSNYVHDTLYFQIQVHGAQVQDTTWTASSWAGTVTLHSPYDPNGQCYAVTLKANVTSSS